MPAPSNSVQAATDIIPITPSDTGSLPRPVRQLRVKPNSGAAGTLRVLTADGEDRTTEIAVGERLDLIVTKVFATGTAATGLEGLV